MYEDSLPIVELRQFFFCPRIPWYHVNNFFPNLENKWMEQGEKYHEDREKLMRKKLLRRFKNQAYSILFRVNVYSVVHGIHGIVDAIIEQEEEVFPVEFKLQKGTLSKGGKFQLLGYALCLEEVKRKKVNTGFVIFGKNAKVQEIHFTAAEKKEACEVISKVKAIRQSGSLPSSSATVNKCIQCEYLNYCNDRDL